MTSGNGHAPEQDGAKLSRWSIRLGAQTVMVVCDKTAWPSSVMEQSLGRGLGKRAGGDSAADVVIRLLPQELETRIHDMTLDVGLGGLIDRDPVRLFYERLEPALRLAGRLLGLTALHVSCAVLATGQVVMFTGGRRTGKSTTSLALAAAGATLLSDDTVFFRKDGNQIFLTALERELHLPRQLCETLDGFRTLLDRPDYFPGTDRIAVGHAELGGFRTITSITTGCVDAVILEPSPDENGPPVVPAAPEEVHRSLMLTQNQHRLPIDFRYADHPCLKEADLNGFMERMRPWRLQRWPASLTDCDHPGKLTHILTTVLDTPVN